MAFVDRVGAYQLYLRDICRQLFTRPFRMGEFVNQLNFIGTESLNIILLTGFFTGAVFGLQIGGIFRIFKAEGLMGGATAIALAKELAPLVTAFLLAGRVGSAMTAEISTMKVGEQITALEAMGVNPIQYLVVPRVLASICVMPLLCGVFMFVGVVGAYITGVGLFEVDQGVFLDKLIALVKKDDVAAGIRKMFFFSVVISTIACRCGLQMSGGAKGVGEATTLSVVKILIYVLAMDLAISYLEIRWIKL